MSNPERFLSRWSRRKRAAVAEPAAAVETSNNNRAALPGCASNVDQPPFDPASLPPIESIVADTDIRAFLAPGAPPELTRAALRRAWVADPKIRDFVGLADYDWDFNAPGSMAGFGPLEMTEELRQTAAQIIGPAMRRLASGAAADGPDLTAMGPAGDDGDAIVLAQNVPAGQQCDPRERSDAAHRNPDGATSQDQPHAPEKSRLIVQPRHGGALPK